MNYEIAEVLLIIGGMVVLFLTESVSKDTAALLGLLLLTLLGFLTPQEAFSGFSSDATITIIPIFIIGAGIRYTGLAEILSARIYRLVGTNEIRNVFAVMLIAAFVSSFMNNVAAVALLLPAVVGISYRSQIPASRLLIPLSFGTLLGGTVTLIGTSSNILASQILSTHGLKAYSFFSFTPYGLVITFIGILFVGLWGYRMLPRNITNDARFRSVDLPRLYKLDERIFAVRIPYNSRLNGETLQALHFEESLDLGVVCIIRQGQKILAPGPTEKTRAGDVLVVRGRVFEFESLQRFKDVKVAPFDTTVMSQKLSRFAYKVSNELIGRSIRDLKLPSKYGLLVASILRKDEEIFHNLSYEKLLPDDVLVLIGKDECFDKLSADFIKQEIDANNNLRHRGDIFVIDIGTDSQLLGLSLTEAKIGELTGTTVLGLVRDDNIESLNLAGIQICPKDRLIVAGEMTKVESLARLGDLEIMPVPSDTTLLESSEIGLVEVVLSPRSRLLGKTLSEVNFRDKYDMQVVAIWREGQPLRARLSRIPLKFGDALLLQGPRSKMPVFSTDPDFVVLADTGHGNVRAHKQLFALFSIFLLIFLSASGLTSIDVAAWVSALVLVLSGTLSMEEGYREVDWRIVVLMSALIPLGIVLQKVGLVNMLSEVILAHSASISWFYVLMGICLLTSLFSQALDSAPTVVFMAPIAIAVANGLSLDPRLFVMAVALSASNAFLTPFSHRAHMLVMGVGGYTKRDYLKVGVVLTGLYFLALAVLILLSSSVNF
jgi:di/tricarboxylate transporter